MELLKFIHTSSVKVKVSFERRDSMRIKYILVEGIVIISVLLITNCTTLSEVSDNVVSNISDPKSDEFVQTAPRDQLCKTCVTRNYNNLDGLSECNYLCSKEKLMIKDCRCMQRHLKEDSSLEAYRECEEHCRST